MSLEEPLRIVFGVDPDQDWYDLKWCRKHGDIAKVYSDGSGGCWWENVVEGNGYHEPDDFITLAAALGLAGETDE